MIPPQLSLGTLAVAAAYGFTPLRVASAAWLWFEWRRDKQGHPVAYRWVWEKEAQV